jgi:hypothetical protein
MPKTNRVLTDDQITQFLERGHVVLHDCFSRELAQEWTEQAFRRLGCDAHDPATWREARIHMPTARRMELKGLAPRAWAAACELLGGEERIKQPCHCGDGFIVNFSHGAGRLWKPPSAGSPGWHKDGDFFRHFLDSPEQGLLTLVIWSDIEHRGGGTFIACDSVPAVARYLAARPEGVRPAQIDVRSLVAGCQEFVEFTGQVGDVVLLHPFMLHASSPNHSGKPRFLTNPPIQLKKPMCFNRMDPAEHSLVEQAVLRGLGVERLEFAPTGKREKITPQRVLRQRKMLREEKSRLSPPRRAPVSGG